MIILDLTAADGNPVTLILMTSATINRAVAPESPPPWDEEKLRAEIVAARTGTDESKIQLPHGVWAQVCAAGEYVEMFVRYEGYRYAKTQPSTKEAFDEEVTQEIAKHRANWELALNKSRVRSAIYVQGDPNPKLVHESVETIRQMIKDARL